MSALSVFECLQTELRQHKSTSDDLSSPLSVIIASGQADQWSITHNALHIIHLVFNRPFLLNGIDTVCNSDAYLHCFYHHCVLLRSLVTKFKKCSISEHSSCLFIEELSFSVYFGDP